MIRTYFEIAKRGYRRHTAYVAGALAGLFTNLVFGVLRVAVLRAVYESSGSTHIGGLTVNQAISYVWLTQSMLMVVQIYGSAEIAQRVRSGAIAVDLLRPIRAQHAYLAADFGRAAYYVTTRAIPLAVVGIVTSGLVAPRRPDVAALFVASVASAVAVSFLYRFLTNLTAFWIVDYRGVALVSVILANLLSGFIIPVTFFPGWLERVASVTPFPSMVQLPIDIFIGRVSAVESLGALAVQWAWIVGLYVAGRVAFARGRYRLVVQGG